MAIHVFWEGVTPVVTAEFTVEGVPTNPTAVTWYWTKPDGTEAAADVHPVGGVTTNPQTGRHTWSRQMVDAGEHRIRVVGTGACAAVMEARIIVRDSTHSSA